MNDALVKAIADSPVLNTPKIVLDAARSKGDHE
jgi:hypothetical protein